MANQKFVAISLIKLNKSCLLFLLLQTVLVSVFQTKSIHGYNLSPQPNFEFVEPQLNTFTPKVESSYFGYTLNLRSQSIFVGAPRAQSSFESQRNLNETGVIYRCYFKGKPCYPYQIDTKGNFIDELNEYTYDSEKRDNQWLGGAMDGGTSDDDILLVCAPRFIAPAINDYLMHGVCYWTPNTLTEQPLMVKKISPLRLRDYQIREQMGTRYYYYMLAEQGLSAHVSANNKEMLIGAPGVHTWKGTVIRYREKNETDPGLSRRDISALRTARQVNKQKEYKNDVPNPDNWQQPNDSYFGYSVASGYFDSLDLTRLLYVATAPQANLSTGEAVIFDVTGDSITKLHTFRGSKFGEYFGYSVISGDYNGDGLADVIVSAPQYSITGNHENGAIYMFINKGRFNFEKRLLVSPMAGSGRFGTTLSNLGDINLDGYNDIAVSAPFAGNGSVFIYLGGEKGLRNMPSQRLDSPPSLPLTYGNHMFGHGLSKGADIDGNHFNDIAIGAPNAEAVLVYRAYPVVKVVASIKADSREISPDQKKIAITVCYSIATKSDQVKDQELKMIIKLDPQIKRVKLVETRTNELMFVAHAGRREQCRVLYCEVRYSVVDIFKPIELELHYELKKVVPNSKEFCNECVAVDPAEPKMSTEKIIFNTGCASEICVADMKVQSSELDHNYVLGSSRSLSVTYEVSNSGETAYLPQINITSSNRMPFNKIPSNCNLNNNVLLCDLNRGQPMTKGKTDSITVSYDVSDIKGRHMILTADVYSTGQEFTNSDNRIRDVITLKEFTEIEIIGKPKTDHVNLEQVLDKITEIESIYEIKSNGPSDVDTLDIVVNIPVAYRIEGSNKIIQIIDPSNIRMTSAYDSQSINIHFYQNEIEQIMGALEVERTSVPTHDMFRKDDEKADLHALVHLSQNHIRQRRELAELTATTNDYALIAQRQRKIELLSEDLRGSLPVNRTVYFNCHDSQFTICMRAVMSVPFFKRDKPLSINLKYKANLQEINSILTEPWEFFVFIIDFSVKRNGDLIGDSLRLNQNIKYNIVSKHQLYGIPLWVIILAVLGGILVLALISYGLYKAGFFKRTTKEELNKLVQQKAEGDAETDNLNEPGAH